MIFRPEMVRLIREGRKTMTRRPVKQSVCRYKTGRVYAVQPGRGRPASQHVTVTDVREEPLGAISLPDAKREGFRTRADFFDYWRELYDSEPDEQMVVWVISFVAGDQTDRPRLLARRLGGAGGDYTSVPALSARGEQESPSARELNRFAQEAEHRHDKTTRDLWAQEQAKIRQSITALERREWSPPVAHEIELLKRRLNAIDRRLRAA